MDSELVTSPCFAAKPGIGKENQSPLLGKELLESPTTISCHSETNWQSCSLALPPKKLTLRKRINILKRARRTKVPYFRQLCYGYLSQINPRILPKVQLMPFLKLFKEAQKNNFQIKKKCKISWGEEVEVMVYEQSEVVSLMTNRNFLREKMVDTENSPQLLPSRMMK